MSSPMETAVRDFQMTRRTRQDERDWSDGGEITALRELWYSAQRAKLTRQEAVVEYAIDEIFKLIPDEYADETAEEYYERVTEGELPRLFDALLKKKKAALAEYAKSEAGDIKAVADE